MQKFATVCVVMACLTMLGGCSTGAYLWQATSGHLQVLGASQQIEKVLAQPQISATLRTQLQHVQVIRKYSVEKLALPDNESYTSYADLNRPFAVWNVVAAPPDSLQLKTWCFPFTGCISYKGFYRESDAVKLADELRSEGLDVAVLGVPAYSTLGFTPDPVLNTFVNYPAGELARLIFHELAHQVVYIGNDTMFNESFATAVEELGVEAWLGEAGHEELKVRYRTFDDRRVAFRTLLDNAREDLKSLYADPRKLADTGVLDAKQVKIETLRRDYELLKKSWGGWSGYDRFMGVDLNNAKLGVSGLYTAHVPAFKALFELCGSDFPRFYAAVRKLGKEPADRRVQWLDELSSGRLHQPSGCL